MSNPIGDTAEAYHTLPHPIGSPLRLSMSRNITKLSGNALYWILQLAILLITISFNILCNPVVWFVLKTVFNVITEVFIYMVLAACSFVISIITHLDDYYTKGRDQMRNKFQHCSEAVQGSSSDMSREGVKVQKCTIKRFVEIPKTL